MTIAKLNNRTLEQGTFGSAASRSLPTGFSNQRSVEIHRGCIPFCHQATPRPFLEESGLRESGGKTEDKNNLEGKGNSL